MSAYETTIDLDPNTYSVDAVLTTSYWYASRFVIQVVHSTPRLCISIRSQNLEPITQDIVDEILIRLTDEELRVRLRRQFAEMETLIVRTAFAPVHASQEQSKMHE